MTSGQRWVHNVYIGLTTVLGPEHTVGTVCVCVCVFFVSRSMSSTLLTRRNIKIGVGGGVYEPRRGATQRSTDDKSRTAVRAVVPINNDRK